ncbi:MAG: hypothetical protein AAF921_01990 [Cyanobacteria bacterium P01_D01_bin.44]
MPSLKLPPETASRVLSILDAFSQLFGPPTSELELRAVIGAILMRVEKYQVLPQQMIPLVERLVAAYRARGTATAAVGALADAAAEGAARQVKAWLKKREEAIAEGLAAYAQQFESTLDSATDLIDVTQTLIAILSDGQFSPQEGRWLLQTAVEKFNLAEALQKWVPPEWFAIAHQVAQYREKATFESTVFAVVQAYMQRFQSMLTPALMEQILKNGTLNIDPSQLLEGDIVRLTDLMVFKMQLLEASPMITKSDEEIAAQVHSATEQFKATYGWDGDISQPIASGDLEVSSRIIFERSESVVSEWFTRSERADTPESDRQV